MKYDTQGRDVGELEKNPHGGFVEEPAAPSCKGELGASWMDLMIAISFSDVM